MSETKVYKSIKYRIYPTEEQKVFFTKAFGCCRFVYNYFLNKQIELYKNNAKHMSYFDMIYELTLLKNDFPFLKEVDATAFYASLFNLDAAYKNFFRAKKGFPKYKSEKSKKSYTTSGQIRICDNSIKLPKTKKVKAKISKLPPAGSKIKKATISQESDGKYYCSIMYEYITDIVPVNIAEDKVIGLNFLPSCLYVDSDGNIADMPKFLKSSQDKLAKEQRKLAKKVGNKRSEDKSSNWYKQNSKTNKIHRHIANQRKDFLHKLSTELANNYDAICIRNISVEEMVSDAKYKDFRKSILDNGWNSFINMLKYKLEDKGKRLVIIERFLPVAKTCSNCGTVNEQIDYNTPEWKCPCCHTVHNRNVNTAINIKNKGLQLIYQSDL